MSTGWRYNSRRLHNACSTAVHVDRRQAAADPLTPSDTTTRRSSSTPRSIHDANRTAVRAKTRVGPLDHTSIQANRKGQLSWPLSPGRDGGIRTHDPLTPRGGSSEAPATCSSTFSQVITSINRPRKGIHGSASDARPHLPEGRFGPGQDAMSSARCWVASRRRVALTRV